MSDEHRPPEGDPGEGGLFGKLPSERPGVRSPRRRAAKGQQTPVESADPATVSGRARRTGASGRSSAPSAPTPPSTAQETDVPASRGARRESPEAPRRESDAPESPREGGGVEDLAWAGITVAAEAATLGVRLLSRAVEAVRKPADRP